MHLRSRFRERSEEGVSLVLVALMMLIMIGLLAVVVDGGNGRQTRRQAQAVADAAALAGASKYSETGSTPSAISMADTYATNNGYLAPGGTQGCGTHACVYSPPIDGSHSGVTGCVEVKTTQSLGATFSAALGKTGYTAGARAVACDLSGGSFSVIVLDHHACQAFDQEGNNFTLTAIGGIYVNSDCTTGNGAFYNGFNNFVLNAAAVDVVGASNQGKTWDGSPCGGPTTPCSQATTVSQTLADPLASLPVPTGTTTPGTESCAGSLCSFTPGLFPSAVNLPNHKDAIFAPGDYNFAGGLSISGSATFGSGVYIFGGSGFSDSSNSNGTTITATNVLFYFAGASSTMSYANNTPVSISGPSAAACAADANLCPYVSADVAIFVDRSDATPFNFVANNGNSLVGTVYAAGTQVIFNTNSNNVPNLPLSIVADTLQIGKNQNNFTLTVTGAGFGAPGTPALVE